MKSNRTSSFPADDNNKSNFERFEDRAMIALCVSVGLIATGAHWLYINGHTAASILLMVLTTSQCVCAVLYRWATKRRRKNNNSAGT